jgi:hypothetical protein
MIVITGSVHCLAFSMTVSASRDFVAISAQQ